MTPILKGAAARLVTGFDDLAACFALGQLDLRRTML